jgi:hypothetical protein
MKDIKNISRSRAQESSAAIERLYITMRHLFNRGFYKPMGVSGETLREALLSASTRNLRFYRRRKSRTKRTFIRN